MNPAIINEQQHHILFDSDLISDIVPQWFDIAYWQDRAAVKSASRGRGQAWFIETNALHMVLRHYRRGGWMAPLLGDRYVRLGLAQSRAWREWRLLAQLSQQGLPVPQPLAAHVQTTGIFYRANILTRLIPHARPLSEWLSVQSFDSEIWQTIGQTIRRFHLAGACHADLNAHNILIDEANQVFIIDFDKGDIRSAQDTWQKANLQRLQRSLQKLRGLHDGFNFKDANWHVLMDGYQSV